MFWNCRWRSAAWASSAVSLVGAAILLWWRQRVGTHRISDKKQEEVTLAVEADGNDEVCTPATSSKSQKGIEMERARAAKHWAEYQKFQTAPGNKCPECWLMKKHCCCGRLKRLDLPELRPRVVVLMHYSELGRHLGSNTAKVLFQFGAELVAWGVAEHEARFEELIRSDPEGTVVLFPGPNAVTAHELRSRYSPGDVGTAAFKTKESIPRLVLILDGGWRECKHINEAIDPSITRVVVTEARREEYGGTRKYGTGKNDDAGRVQTAAAFIALMQELGEDPAHVSVLKEGLACFMSAWESQICRSKTFVK